MSDKPWSDGPDLDDWLGEEEYYELEPSIDDLFEPVDLHFDRPEGHQISDEAVEELRAELADVRWFYDTSGYYAYVLMDARPDPYRFLVEQLRESRDIEVSTTGPARRPGSNGVVYEWYVRVVRSGGGAQHPELERIEGVFEDFLSQDQQDDDSDAPGYYDYPPTSAQVLGADKSVGREIKPRGNAETDTASPDPLQGDHPDQSALHEPHHEDAQDGESAHARPKRDYEALQKRYDETANLLQYYQAEHAKIAAILGESQYALSQEIRRRRALDDRSRRLAARIEKLYAAKEDADYTIEKELADFADENDSLKMQLQEKNRTIDELRKDDVERAKEPLVLRRDQEVTIESILNLFPNVKLVNGSVDVLTKEYAKALPALQIISELSRTGRFSHAKGVKAAPGWFEVRVNTGSNVSGRLYFRSKSGEIEMLIGEKRTQRNDVRDLMSMT